MQLTLTGEPADLAAFCQAVGRQPRIDDFGPSKVYDSVEDYLATMPQEPAKCPGLKDRDLLTTMLPKPGSSSHEAIGKPQKLSKETKQSIQTIVQGHLLAGNDWATIQTALDEEGIHLTDRQLHGWIGLVKKGMKAQDRPKDATRTELEGNRSSIEESAIKGQMVPTETKAEILNVVHAAALGPVVTPESQIPDIRPPPSKNRRWETPLSSNVDADIDRLNKEGKSSREISSILSGQGINLTWQQVRGRIAYMARKGPKSPVAEVEPSKERLPVKETDPATKAEPAAWVKRIIELDSQKMTPHTISDILEEETGAIVSEAEVMDIIVRNAKGML